MTETAIPVSGAVEGVTDETILRVVLSHCNREASTIYVQGGKSKLIEKLAGFNSAARYMPWVVLLDLDCDDGCAPTHVQRLLPNPSAQMTLRVAVHQAEAWLLADRAGLARYLRVREHLIPDDPDGELNAKQTMVNLARKSSNALVRRDMVPAERSGRTTGPNYAGRLIEFATLHWNLGEACQRSDSLSRCVSAIAA